MLDTPWNHRALCRGFLVALGLVVVPARPSAQQANNISLEAHLPLPPCTTADVTAMGDYVYLARRHLGFSVVDVRDPQNPVLTTIAPPGYPLLPSQTGVNDVKTDGKYLYCSDEGSPNGAGVFIYNLQGNPMNPSLVSMLGTGVQPLRVHNLWVDGTTLYAQRRMYNIAQPFSPAYMGDLTSGFVHDIIVIDNRAYVSKWRGGIEILDVTNPRRPIQLGSVLYPGAVTHNMWPSEDGRFLFTTDERADGDVRVWDISQLPNIRQVAAWRTGPPGSVVHNAHVSGDLLFVTYYREGLRVLNIKDPLRPVEIAYYDTYPETGLGCNGAFSGAWGVHPWRRDLVFVSDLQSGAYILRVHPIAESLLPSATVVPAGAAFDLQLSYGNLTEATLDAFSVVTLSAVDGAPSFLPLFWEFRSFQPREASVQHLPIPVPPGVPAGLTMRFSALTGLASPVLLSTQLDVDVTVGGD
ncbi:MAG: choice-of-anchor B family protein [Planctomycetota bacterium]